MYWLCASPRPSTFFEGVAHKGLCGKVVPRGLEPRTLRLLAVRSNQLSYETSWEQISKDAGEEFAGIWIFCACSCGMPWPRTVEEQGHATASAPACLQHQEQQQQQQNDTEGIRTPAGRAQWISSPSP